MKTRSLALNKVLDRSDVIPPQKGIYVWKYNFDMLLNKFHENPIEAKIALSNLIEIFKVPLINGEVRSIFNIKYYYNFDNTKNNDGINIFTEEEIDDKILNEIIYLLKLYSPPIYIGKANNLKERYKSHLDSYNRAKINNDNSEKNIFTSRLINLGIEMHELLFCYNKIENLEKKSIIKIEKTLNYIIKPFGGEQ